MEQSMTSAIAADLNAMANTLKFPPLLPTVDSPPSQPSPLIWPSQALILKGYCAR